MLSQLEIDQLIQTYPVLEEMPTGLKSVVYTSSHTIHAEAGKFLFDADLADQSFLLLLEGLMRVTWLTKEREVLLYRVKPGDCCLLTLCSLLGSVNSPARAQAESSLTGVVISQSHFMEMMQRSPAFCSFILRSLSNQLTKLLGLVESLASMPLEARLASLLLSKGSIIKISHVELANELGSVREVISRILEDFETRGLIQLGRRKIQILDEESLKKIALE